MKNDNVCENRHILKKKIDKINKLIEQKQWKNNMNLEDENIAIQKNDKNNGKI